MGRFSLAKSIERRLGHDPGISAGLQRCYAGIIDARKGLRRAESLVKNTSPQNRSGETGGLRELAAARQHLDEAEMWIAASIHAIKSDFQAKPTSYSDAVRAQQPSGYARLNDSGPLAEEDLVVRVFTDLNGYAHARVLHRPTGTIGEAEGHDGSRAVRDRALDHLLGKLEVIGG